MELRHYLRVLRRSWVLIATCVVVAVAAGWVLIMLTTAQYVSTTRLFVTTPLSDAGVAGAYEGTLFAQQRVASYANIVGSDLLAARVVEASELDAEPGDLANQVSARIVPDTVLLDITVTGPSPEDAQDLATAYAEEFVTLVSEIESPPSGGDPLVSATVMNTADLPISPVSPRPVRTLSLAAILGLLAGIVIAILRDILDTTIGTAEQLPAITLAPNLGVIPYDPNAREHPLIVRTSPRSPRSEAYRQLRTNLQFVDVDAERKALVMTSSVPEEGKTTTTANLALSLADAGVRVVLLEADLRRPRVADYLGLVAEVGLTNLLVGSISIDDAIQTADGPVRHGQSNLQVISSGPIPPNPSELLQSRAMTDLMTSLRERADIVLIDSPPLLPVTDAAILSTLADGAILVVRHGRTSTDQVHQAAANLQTVDARLLGTILAMTPTTGPKAYRSQYAYNYETTPTDTSPNGSSSPTQAGMAAGSMGMRRRLLRYPKGQGTS